MKTYVIMIAKNFFKGHINAGELTNFRKKIEKGEKIHTIRPNYDLWAKRIYEVNMGRAILSIREWIEKPYHSKQREIYFLTQFEVECQQIIYSNDDCYSIPQNPFGLTNHYNIQTIAKNDGLTPDQFNSWFKNYDLSKPMAIIHFTNFRY
jgi:hypothetical protein